MKYFTMILSPNDPVIMPYRAMTDVNPEVYLYYENDFFDKIDQFLKKLEDDMDKNKELDIRKKRKSTKERLKMRKEAIEVVCQKCKRKRKTNAIKSCQCFYCGNKIEIKEGE